MKMGVRHAWAVCRVVGRVDQKSYTLGYMYMRIERCSQVDFTRKYTNQVVITVAAEMYISLCTYDTPRSRLQTPIDIQHQV